MKTINSILKALSI